MGITVFKMFIWEGISSVIWSKIEGASATRYLNPLFGKIELSIMSCRKHVSSSDYLPLTIERSQEMNLKVFLIILQKS